LDRLHVTRQTDNRGIIAHALKLRCPACFVKLGT
jgi:hypothetical protein